MSTKTTPNNRNLSEFLCFAIYSANLAFGKVYKTHLDKLGVTYLQYVAIISLWEQDGQTVSELGTRLHLESNTLTPMLKKLESLGYVKRARDPKDERQVRINLTDKGRKLRESARSINLAGATGLSPQEFTEMQKNVVRLRDNLLKAAGSEES